MMDLVYLFVFQSIVHAVLLYAVVVRLTSGEAPFFAKKENGCDLGRDLGRDIARGILDEPIQRKPG